MRMRLFALFAVFLLAFPAEGAKAKIIHVPADSSTIQAGINGALDGDTVLVARGHYYETIDFAGTAILVASYFIFDNDTTTIDSTIIDGGGSGTVVVFPGYGPSASTIRGFTITNGYPAERGRTLGWSGEFAIRNDILTGSYANYTRGEVGRNDNPPVIANNIITGNDFGIYCEGYTNKATSGNFTRGGLGVYCWSPTPTIKHNTVANNSHSAIACKTSSPTISSNNVIDNGGIGIYCHTLSSPTIHGNVIIGNSGGGISCRGGSSPVVANNTISGNSTLGEGGGIYCEDNSSPVIDSNTISSNSGYYGGGICCWERSSPVVSNNTIIFNSANNGGGIYCVFSSPTIRGNTVSDNSAAYYGGGILCSWDCLSTIQHNTITDNFAGFDGGGIFCYDFGSPVITNNTITGNCAILHGGGIRCTIYSWPVISSNIISHSLDGEGISCESGSNATIRHNDVWANADGDFHNCPTGVGDTSWGINFNGTPCDSFCNIIRDPLFADTIDFELLCNSPCIDAGDPDIPVALDSGGCRIDIGAREYLYILGDANSDGSIEPKGPKVGAVTVGDIVFVLNYLFRKGPEPCPFHAADTNCDGTVDTEDLVCLINYFFRGGDIPC
jgi:parallel beta-helix repeat protein